MRLLYSLLLSASLLKLSLGWDCDARCPLDGYLECLEQEAQNGNRQLFPPDHTDNDDAPYFDAYEQKEPKTLDMSVYTPTALYKNKNGLRGSEPMHDGHHHRELEGETYFQLKLYHELGYCWQSEWEDRLWCAECTNECDEWDYLEIQKCDETENKQYFFYEAMPNGVGGRIKPFTNTSLCWERTRVNAHQLKACDDVNGTVNVTQIFRDFSYTEKFELHPFNRGDNTTHPDGAMCLSNHHHPKKQEVIRAELCTSAQADNSSFWMVYNAYTQGNTSGSNQEMDDLIAGGGASDTTLVPTEAPSAASSESWSEFPSTLVDSSMPTDFLQTNIPTQVTTEVTSAIPSVSPSPLPTPAPQEPTSVPVDSTNESVQQGDELVQLQDRGWGGCNETDKCPRCAGDCDGDDECQGDLICYRVTRSRNGPVPTIPTCSGGENIQRRKAFCIPPNWNEWNARI